MDARALLTICAVIVATAVLSFGCASGPRVYVHAVPEFSPSAYRTFGFLKEAETNRAGYSTLLTQYLETAAARELQARGYHPSTDPDLLVNFYVVTRDRLQTTPTSSAYYGWRRAYGWNGMGYTNEVRSFTEGTLNIDIIDRARKQLVWEGVAVGRVTEQKLKDPQPAIDGAVAAIFARFPLGTRGVTAQRPAIEAANPEVPSS
jgi:hypothetical protein